MAIDAHRLYDDEILSPTLFPDGIPHTKHDDGTVDQYIGGDIPAMTHDDGIAILDGYFLNSPVDLASADMLALDKSLGPEDENQSLNCPLSTAQSNTSGPLPASDQPSDSRSDTADTTGLSDLGQAPEPCESSNNVGISATHTRLAKRVILDESGHQLEDVVEALEKEGR